MLCFSRYLLLSLISIIMMACGYQLRGTNEFTYQTLFISGHTQINKALIKNLASNGVQVVSNADEGQMQLELLKEDYEKRILSLSGTGVVREYELYYRLHYRTRGKNQALWSEPVLMEVRRDFSYNDQTLLGKEAEEKRLVEDMHRQVVRNLVRRLSVLK